MAEIKYTPRPEDVARVENNHRYHPAQGDQGGRYDAIRTATGGLAKMLLAVCPPSRELSVALTKLEEVMFWANASIAREPPGGG